MIFGLVSNKEAITRKFEADIPESLSYTANYNLREGANCIFLSSAQPQTFTNYRFGMIPCGSKGEKIFYQAQVENVTHHSTTGILRRDIIHSPYFQKAIRQQRGLLPVDYIIVESEARKPYLLFLKDKKRPMGLACVWDAWKKDMLDELVYGFAVVTVPVYGGELEKLGIKEIPLILNENSYKKWLKTDASLAAITHLLNPVDEKLINGYPVSDKILTCDDNERSLIDPVGEFIFKEEKMLIPQIRSYYGHKKKKDNGDGPTLGERMLNDDKSVSIN